MKKMIKPIALLCAILVVSLGVAQSDHNADWSCDAGWVTFNDEKCFKIFDNTTRTYAEAVNSCASLAVSTTLPTIHSKDEQEFLSNYLFNTSKIVENFWIGAQFVNNTFGWGDKSAFRYTNWDSRGPRRRANYCVQMQFDEGKWYDDPCVKKHAVVCQKIQTWSMARLQQTLLDARRQMKDALVETNRKNDNAIKQISEYKHEIYVANRKISILEKNQIPIGFLYTQLPKEKPPTAIWPSMTWTDVSSAYGGVFFRVEGGGSEPFQQIQAENDRSVIRMETTFNAGISVYKNITIGGHSVGQSTEISDWVWTGDSAKDGYYEDLMKLRLVTSTGEIRPRNMAIRVWKRTG